MTKISENELKKVERALLECTQRLEERQPSSPASVEMLPEERVEVSDILRELEIEEAVSSSQAEREKCRDLRSWIRALVLSEDGAISAANVVCKRWMAEDSELKRGFSSNPARMAQALARTMAGLTTILDGVMPDELIDSGDAVFVIDVRRRVGRWNSETGTGKEYEVLSLLTSSALTYGPIATEVIATAVGRRVWDEISSERSLLDIPGFAIRMESDKLLLHRLSPEQESAIVSPVAESNLPSTLEQEVATAHPFIHELIDDLICQVHVSIDAHRERVLASLEELEAKVTAAVPGTQIAELISLLRQQASRRAEPQRAVGPGIRYVAAPVASYAGVRGKAAL